jgi:hypothetical protein
MAQFTTCQHRCHRGSAWRGQPAGEGAEPSSASEAPATAIAKTRDQDFNRPELLSLPGSSALTPSKRGCVSRPVCSLRFSARTVKRSAMVSTKADVKTSCDPSTRRRPCAVSRERTTGAIRRCFVGILTRWWRQRAHHDAPLLTNLRVGVRGDR